jgi:predicted N-acyltransferase
MEIEIKDTIQDIDEKEWSTLVGTDYIDRSHAWYRTIEAAGLRKMHYVLLREDSTLKAAACCFPYIEKMYIKVPLLEVRSPLGTSSAFFAKTPEHARMLIAGLEEILNREKAKGISILELNRKEFISVRQKVKGFTHFPIYEDTYIDLHFAGFDTYLTTLRDSTRRSVRNTLNKAKRWKIEPLFTSEIARWKEVACRLHGHICDQHKDYRTYLAERFYEACEKYLKDKAELLLCFRNDIPIACTLLFHSPNISFCKFAGIDPKYRKYQAYFLMYYETIKRAIEKDQKRVYFGPSAYDFKQKIGCEREERLGIVRLKNPGLHLTLKSYMAISRLFDKKF